MGQNLVAEWKRINRSIVSEDVIYKARRMFALPNQFWDFSFKEGCSGQNLEKQNTFWLYQPNGNT